MSFKNYFRELDRLGFAYRLTDYSDGLLGLPSAFYIAGARNVMVALWPVGDRGAAVFMDRF